MLRWCVGAQRKRARNEPFTPWAEAWGDGDEASHTHMHECVCVRVWDEVWRQR